MALTWETHLEVVWERASQKKLYTSLITPEVNLRFYPFLPSNPLGRLADGTP